MHILGQPNTFLATSHGTEAPHYARLVEGRPAPRPAQATSGSLRLRLQKIEALQELALQRADADAAGQLAQKAEETRARLAENRAQSRSQHKTAGLDEGLPPFCLPHSPLYGESL